MKDKSQQPAPIPEEPRDLLVHLRLWMENHLQRLASRSYSGFYGAKGNCWTVCEVPDWDMRQRLAEIDAALSTPLGTPGRDKP